MVILELAKAAGLKVMPVRYKGWKRKGFDLVDPNNNYIQYTLEPVSYLHGSFKNEKWMIHHKGEGRVSFVTRVTSKHIDLTKRMQTGFVRLSITNTKS